VGGDVLAHWGWDRDAPSACLGLRWTRDERATNVDDLLSDVHPPVEKVKVAALQPAELPQAQRTPEREQHHRSPARSDRFGEGVHLGDACTGSLGRVVGAAALHLARVHREYSVGDGGVEGSAEHLVATRRRGGVLRPQRCVPRADVGRSEPSESDVAEAGNDVDVE